MTEQTGSIPAPAPEPAAPAAPTEQPTPAPAPSSEPTPAPAPAAPAEGTPPASTPPEGTQPAAPAEPAPASPPAPRESAQLKRAREAREKANGLLGLADKLDPQPAAPPAPAPTPPVAPTTPPTDDLAPDYFDDDGNIDPDKHAAYTRRVAQAEAQRIDADRQTRTAAEQSRAQINAAVSKYADTVDSEAQYLVANVPELNPASPEYDADLDDHIEQAYKRMTTDSQGNLVRIDISLKEFAEQEIKLARKYRTNGAASVPNSQAAQGHDEALTPDSTGGQAPAKDPKDMDADEYEAYLLAKGVGKVQR